MIRLAVTDEIAGFARLWARSMLAETRQVDDLGPFVQLGPTRGHGCHRTFVYHALLRAAEDHLRSSTCTVLDVEGVPLAWACWEAPEGEHSLMIRFLHVADLVRRRGFGSTLLRHVLGHRDGRRTRLTCITRSGAALYRAVAAPALSPGEHATAAEHSRVVEARG
jgi:GNAT superfamily N-acetyltransferase